MLGTPFRWGAQDLNKDNALDCWGFIREAVILMHGWVYPVLTYDDRTTAADHMKQYINVCSEPLKRAKIFCLIVMNGEPLTPFHFGIRISEGVIHSVPRCGVVITRHDRYGILEHRKFIRWNN